MPPASMTGKLNRYRRLTSVCKRSAPNRWRQMRKQGVDYRGGVYTPAWRKGDLNHARLSTLLMDLMYDESREGSAASGNPPDRCTTRVKRPKNMRCTCCSIARFLFALGVSAAFSQFFDTRISYGHEPEDRRGRAGQLTLVAGGGTDGDGASADRAKLVSPFGVGFDAETRCSSSR